MNNSDFELIKQGAEAKLYKGMFLGVDVIVKERFKKLYRDQKLDEQLTKERIKSEARSMLRCQMAGIDVPTIYMIDLYNHRLFMEYFINSITVKDYLETLKDCNDEKLLKNLASRIGKVVSQLHNSNIIHGDLTTSNMLLISTLTESPIILIDFGLSHVGTSSEDKGVDLYVLERALLSSFPSYESFWNNVLSSYRDSFLSANDIIEKLNEIRLRGRKRTMIG